MAITDILSFRWPIEGYFFGGWPKGIAPIALLCGTSLLLAGCQPTPSESSPSPPLNIVCDFNRETCHATTRWGAIRLELSPQPLPVLQPITLALSFEVANGATVNAQLEGREMDMGPNMAAMKRLDSHHLSGQLVIPVCLTGTMKWRLSLHIREGAAEQSLAFEFDAPIKTSKTTTHHAP